MIPNAIEEKIKYDGIYLPQNKKERTL